MSDIPLAGRLLVAHPTLLDPNFVHTVVLLLEHGPDGALGVVLNRASESEVGEVLPGWERVAAPPDMVFVGGPVQPEAAIALAQAGEAPRSDDDAVGWRGLFGALGTVDLDVDPVDIRPRLEAVRVFAGYAGWGAGQLEAEVDAGDWVVVDALPGDCFALDPDGLWRTVLRRQGGRTAWWANWPPSPTVN